jgi:UDP-2-acetamido-3-amino-2,3-dideoxy-glucuronate N-acetyltransferase
MVIHVTADVSSDAVLGKNVQVWHHSQIRENVKIGDNCIFGKNVYVDKNVSIGKSCKIQNNSSIFHGTTLEDGVFIGPYCVFTNDRYPRAVNVDGSVKSDSDWEEGSSLVKEGASLGTSVVILPNVTIGKYAMVGAGSVVTTNVPDFGLVVGNRARLIGYVCKCGRKLEVGIVAGEDCSICKNV